MEKIKNIKEFSKLFKVNVPIAEHFDYYLSTLNKSKEFSKLNYHVAEFINLEKLIEAEGFTSIGNYKMDYALKKLIGHFENTKAYKKFQEFDYSEVSFRTKDELKKNQDEVLISFDLNSANFNALKAFDDVDNSEIAQSWEHQCGDLNIIHGLAISKSFRQLIFGNLNPRRNQKIHHMFIMHFVEMLKKGGYTEDDIVSISHDEVIVKKVVGKFGNRGSNLTNEFNVGELLRVDHQVKIPFSTTTFSVKKIKDEKFFVRTIYKSSNYGFAGILLEEDFKQLWSIPGNKFYMFFRKLILDCDVYDERDLLFISDGMLAKWMV